MLCSSTVRDNIHERTYVHSCPHVKYIHSIQHSHATCFVQSFVEETFSLALSPVLAFHWFIVNPYMKPLSNTHVRSSNVRFVSTSKNRHHNRTDKCKGEANKNVRYIIPRNSTFISTVSKTGRWVRRRCRRRSRSSRHLQLSSVLIA